jgi:hypothetical protein
MEVQPSAAVVQALALLISDSGTAINRKSTWAL